MTANDSIVINQRYKIIELLTQGAFCVVYKVEDNCENNKTKTTTEYKLRPNEDIETAKSHILILQQFINPLLVRYFDSFHDTNLKNFYVITEIYEDTKTLESVLDEYKMNKLTVENDTIQWWAIQLLKGIEFLHRNDMIHHNIKPSNILIRDDDSIILGELGLERDPVVMNEQCLDAGIGTLNYMAPEIIKNYINYTKKIDIWSFGCVLYEMIGLKRLVEGRKAQVISYLINFKENKLSFPNIFPTFLNILKKTLVLSPEKRYASSILLETLMKGFTMPVPRSKMKAVKQKPVQKPKPIFVNNKVSPSPPPNFQRPVSVSVSVKESMKEADNLFKISNYNDAMRYYDEVISYDLNNIDAHFKKARCLRGLSKYSESIEGFDTVLKLDPTNLNALNFKGFSLKSLSRTEEATAVFEQALQINQNPFNANTYFNKALSLHGLRKLEDALQFYDIALQHDPKDAFIYNNKGILLKTLNRFDEACQAYDKAAQLEPQFAYAFNNKGILLYTMKNYKHSIKCYDKAISLYAGYADAYKNKGNSLFEINMYDEAVQCNLKSLDLDPNCTNTLNNLGNTYAFMNKYTEAMQCYDKVLLVEPDSLDTYRNKAVLLKDLGKYEKAIECYDEILLRDPNNQNALTAKQKILEYIGKK